MPQSSSTVRSVLSDEAIVRRVTEQKDTAAFGLLYDRYANKVFAKCYSFTRDRPLAEDLAHDVFLKAYLKLGEFRFEAKFSTWLYSITYHACVEYKRQGAKAVYHQQAYTAEQHQSALSEVESEAILLELQLEQLTELLDKINPEEKALLLMKYQDGMSIDELVQLTGLGESAVKMRLKRAKNKVITLSRVAVVVLLGWLLMSL